MSVVRQSLPFGATLVVSIDFGEVVQDIDARVLGLTHSGKRELLEQVAQVLREDARQQFAEGGDPAWKPLAASTIAAKVAAGNPALTAKGNVPTRLKQGGQFSATSILIATGRLRDSWGRKDSPDHIEIIDVQAGTVEVGSSVPYAGAHQSGTSARTILARAGKSLAFTGSGGVLIFRRQVRHPGLSARPVRVSDEAIVRIKALVEAHLEGDDSGSSGGGSI